LSRKLSSSNLQARTKSKDLLLTAASRDHRLPIVWPKGPQDKVPPVRTQARSATILPNFVGLTFEIHNGKDYVPITVTEDMVGHKLGEFSP
jgi:ribosomal protein S19